MTNQKRTAESFFLNYNSMDQQKQNHLYRETKECTQFGLVWSPPEPSAKDNVVGQSRYLLSCLDTGIISCWDIHAGCNSNKDDNDRNEIDGNHIQKEQNEHVINTLLAGNHESYPILKIRASYNVLYNMEFIYTSNQWYLSVCGDDGVLIYKWRDIYPLLQSKSMDSTTYKTATVAVVELKPISHFHPHPSLNELQGKQQIMIQQWHHPQTHDPPYTSFPSPKQLCHYQGTEINGTSMDTFHNVLYGAAGDSFGCYQWDFETGRILGNLTNPNHKHMNSDFLHSVCVAPGGSSGHVLTGSEDGTMGMWDGKQMKLIEMIHCSDFLEPTTSPPTTKIFGTINHHTNRSIHRNNKLHGWISGIDVETDGNWAVIGGGIDHHSIMDHHHNNTNEEEGGFLALWHLPTRSMIKSRKTRETIQAVSYHSYHDSIVSCGNENVISYWSWSLIENEKQQQQQQQQQSCQKRVWCTSPSCFGLAANERNGMLAVCGAGDILDCFTHVGHKSFTLALR